MRAEPSGAFGMHPVKKLIAVGKKAAGGDGGEFMCVSAEAGGRGDCNETQSAGSADATLIGARGRLGWLRA